MGCTWCSKKSRLCPRGAWRRKKRMRRWSSRRRKIVIKKKAGLQSQKRNDYTSSCLLWHFSKLIIHRAFLPLLPCGQLLKIWKKGETRDALHRLCRPPTWQFLPFLDSAPPHSVQPCFLVHPSVELFQTLNRDRGHRRHALRTEGACTGSWPTDFCQELSCCLQGAQKGATGDNSSGG